MFNETGMTIEHDLVYIDDKFNDFKMTLAQRTGKFLEIKKNYFW